MKPLTGSPVLPTRPSYDLPARSRGRSASAQASFGRPGRTVRIFAPRKPVSQEATALKPRSLTVLCLFAHPDDESFACGGTIAELASRGTRVILVTFTGGEASTQEGPRRLSATALKTVRKRELVRSSRILGIAKTHILDFPDGKMDRIAPTTLLRRSVGFIKRYRPAAVFSFTPDGVTKHRDHRMISKIARIAVRRWNRLPANSQVVLCLFGFPNNRRRQARYHIVRGQSYIRLDIRSTLEKKLRAIFQHKSQTTAMRRFQHPSRRALRSFFRYEYVLKYGQVRSPSDLTFFPRP